MQELVKMENKGTMTSLQLVEVINTERLTVEGKKDLAHADLLKIIRDEFEEEINEGKFSSVNYTDKKGEQRPMYQLTYSQCKQLLVRESKAVRKKVIARLEELENSLSKLTVPQSYLEALKALVVSEEQKQLAIAERDNAIATKAEIGTRREATAMNTASQYSKENQKLKIELDKSKSYATIKAVQEFTEQSIKFKPLRDYCIAKELELKKAFDSNYGSVNSYPAEAWLEVYGVDLKEIF